MQCKWCVIRVVVNDMKYYCFRSGNLKGLENNHIQNSFLHFLTNIWISLEAHLISSAFCIWLSKALHISYLISWDLHCEIWFERKLSMVIIVIHFILQWQTKTKPLLVVSEHLSTKQQPFLDAKLHVVSWACMEFHELVRSFFLCLSSSQEFQSACFPFFLSDFSNRCTTILLKLIAVVIRHLGNRWK